MDGHQIYLNSAHPAKDIDYQGLHQRGGSYNYPAEADSSHIRSSTVNGNGIGLAINKIEGDSGFFHGSHKPDKF